MLHHYAMNFVPDSTIDEFYVWGDPDLGASEGLERLWRVGRYYRGGDAWYLSPAVDLADARPAPVPPPGGTAADPPEAPRSAPVAPDRLSSTSSGPPAPGAPAAGAPSSTSPVPRPRLLALAWTAVAGAYDRGTDALLLFDHQTEPPTPLRAAVRAAVSTDGGATWRGRRDEPAADPRSLAPGALWTDAGWSPFVDEAGTDIGTADPERVRVAFHFDTATDPLNSILLESLVLDDVTLFHDPGRAEILEYIAE
jgi:hypothetical protein